MAVENTKTKALLSQITLKIKPDSIIYTDAYFSYDALDVSEFLHHRINHSEVSVDEKNHINEIKNFWNQTKQGLRKYNGIDKKYFHLFLKKCDVRFNYGTPNNLLKILRKGCWV